MFNGPAASGATTDLLLSSMVFWVASFVDARARNIAHWWIVLPATLLVGLSLAMPLWLLMRSRKA